MTSVDLKKQLIKLGSANLELRPHIRKVLAAVDTDRKWEQAEIDLVRRLEKENLSTYPESHWGRVVEGVLKKWGAAHDIRLMNTVQVAEDILYHVIRKEVEVDSFNIYKALRRQKEYHHNSLPTPIRDKWRL